MRKLVKLDPHGYLTEIDMKDMRRKALALKAYIESAPRHEEELFQYKAKVLPLVEAALNGSLQIPYKGGEPYSWRLMLEGLEPMLLDEFADLYAPFCNRIDGSSRWSNPGFLRTGEISDYHADIVEKDGEQYQWVEFEERTLSTKC